LATGGDERARRIIGADAAASVAWKKTNMKLQFFDSKPRRTLEPELRSLVLHARRLDAAVAFVTRPGTALIRQYVKSNPSGTARLVASVRFPTDLQELAKVEDDFPGTVFLHTGFLTPREEDAERGQFHSKIALLEFDDVERCVVIGSHNWTGNALQGHNLEAGMILRGQESDPIVIQVREHIDACIADSEPFQRERLRFYETIQRELHVGPRAPDSDDFPGFEEFDALVIHAEDGTGQGLPRPMQLFVPVRDPDSRSFFADGRRVVVFVYPAGTLLGQNPPTASPIAYEGDVTMTNIVRDAPVNRREATCRINDLMRPVIDVLPDGTVPAPSGESSQVVIRLDDRGPTELPIFHSAAQHPKMKLGIDYRPVRRDERATSVEIQHKHITIPVDPADVAWPTDYRVPDHLTLRTIIRVPSPQLYRADIQRQLLYVLHSSDFSDPSMVPDLRIEEPTQTSVLNDYAYHVRYRITAETIARIERQMKLIRDM
jgi:hypothetical protein